MQLPAQSSLQCVFVSNSCRIFFIILAMVSFSSLPSALEENSPCIVLRSPMSLSRKRTQYCGREFALGLLAIDLRWSHFCVSLKDGAYFC